MVNAARHGKAKNLHTPMFRAAFVLLLAGALVACSDSGPRPGGPQEFQSTLTGLHAVKKGGEETLPLEGLPAESATWTLGR